ncbi:MAG: hypothetical protein KJT03_15170, partial [Verrucomicrobiae bacterium]|nr:hypothetical protein [Verrucomicrobiae bacterium]
MIGAEQSGDSYGGLGRVSDPHAPERKRGEDRTIVSSEAEDGRAVLQGAEAQGVAGGTGRIGGGFADFDAFVELEGDVLRQGGEIDLAVVADDADGAFHFRGGDDADGGGVGGDVAVQRVSDLDGHLAGGGEGVDEGLIRAEGGGLAFDGE